jgi:hypothetical protein
MLTHQTTGQLRNLKAIAERDKVLAVGSTVGRADAAIDFGMM